MAVGVVINDEQMVIQLRQMLARLNNNAAAYREIANLELSQTKMRFRTQEDPSGQMWAIPFTIRRVGGASRSGGYTREQAWNYVLKSNYHAAPPGYRFFDPTIGDRTLIDTGLLLKSIGISYGNNYASVGTNVPYAPAVQNGEKPKKARPFLGINKKTVENVKKVFLKVFKEVKK